MITPRPHKVKVYLTTREHEFVKEYQATRGIDSEEAVMWSALRMLNLIEKTPGALEAVMALRPQLPPGGCMGDD